MRWMAGGALLVLVVPVLVQSQAPTYPPDLGGAGEVLDGALGQIIPPALAAVYNATGQNLTREDVRMYADLNVTKGEASLPGLLLGSGRAELQAKVHLRVELRVLSADRIRALVEGDNAYNISAENATFLTEVYLPADLFRASLTAETAAAFQKAQEAALGDFLYNAVPEMDVLSIEIAWSNVSPLLVATDTDLAEPPIVVELDLVVQYIRIESIPSLLETYLSSKQKPGADTKKAYVEKLKAENGDPLRARDFFAAAAYTQLLNLSMQPGWSLNVNLSVPQGYSFTYANQEVEQRDERHISFEVNALDAEAQEQTVVLAAITHKRAIAAALFLALWGAGLLLAFPLRFFYVRRTLAAK